MLTATGRGSDVMRPMALPVFGGMIVELLTLFVVPVLWSLGWRARLWRDARTASGLQRERNFRCRYWRTMRDVGTQAPHLVQVCIQVPHARMKRQLMSGKYALDHAEVAVEHTRDIRKAQTQRA